MYLRVSIYVCVYVFTTKAKNPSSRLSLSLSLPLPYFVLDVEGSVISLHLTKLNLFLHCFSDLDLFIEHFSLSFACAVLLS